jgi:RNase P/RNase MRP subunit p29
MGGRAGPASSLSRVEREALAGELLGAPIEVASAPGLGRPLRGTIVDETLSTFLVRVPGRARPLRIPKAGLVGTIELPAGELPLRGETLRVRPEDRTKRLLTGGPRRLR